MTWAIHEGDCREVMRTIADASIDAVITDPPYPEVSRDYGRWTEDEWLEMMRDVVAEVRRVLKPEGSAMFIVQQSMEKLGRMRSVIYRWLVEICAEWNVIQDVYWWNLSMMPTAHSAHGLMRPSVKWCVWCGPTDCYRNAHAVLWSPSDAMRALKANGRGRQYSPSGASMDKDAVLVAVLARGGTSPFNLLPISNANSTDSAGAHGHGAGTPIDLAAWWVRYITRPGETVMDPFAGTATIGIAAIELGRSYIGIERQSRYLASARERLEQASRQHVLAL